MNPGHPSLERPRKGEGLSVLPWKTFFALLANFVSEVELSVWQLETFRWLFSFNNITNCRENISIFFKERIGRNLRLSVYHNYDSTITLQPITTIAQAGKNIDQFISFPGLLNFVRCWKLPKWWHMTFGIFVKFCEH